jgi:hypothetical protein
MDSESSTGILPVSPERQAGSQPYQSGFRPDKKKRTALRYVHAKRGHYREEHERLTSSGQTGKDQRRTWSGV